jgi:hypothetical protein
MKALALKSSILSFGKFSIYLVLADEMSDEIDYDALGFQKVITIDQLNITNLDWQLNHYSIVEFNTSQFFAFFRGNFYPLDSSHFESYTS